MLLIISEKRLSIIHLKVSIGKTFYLMQWYSDTLSDCIFYGVIVLCYKKNVSFPGGVEPLECNDIYETGPHCISLS